jgi:uncharacterized protein
MVGTVSGGRNAAKTNVEKYRKDFYQWIGAIGGARSHSGGFGSSEVGLDGLTGKERARVAGAKGGRISRRTKTQS